MIKCFKYKAFARLNLLVQLCEAETFVPLGALSCIILRVSAHFLTIVEELDVWVLLANHVCILVEYSFHDYYFEETEWIKLWIWRRIWFLEYKTRFKHNQTALFEFMEYVNLMLLRLLVAAHGRE